MKFTVTKYDLIALAFLFLITAMEVISVFFMSAPEHRCVLRFVHISVLTFAFHAAIVWLAIKYKAIKDKYHPNG